MRALIALVALCPAGAQEKPKPVPAHAKVDQVKVDEAIDRGCKYLLSSGGIQRQFGWGKRHQPEAQQAHAELILLTLAHSGFYAEGDAVIQQLLEMITKKQIGSTYTASLQAMALQKINPRKYQARIVQCAQFLADNQCSNGQWDYGEPANFDPPKEEPAPVATGGAKPGETPRPKGEVGKTHALPRIPVQKKKTGPPNGDNSNSQYAALGLRACLDAGVVVEPRVLQQARSWWVKSQNRNGGWGYNGNGVHDESGEVNEGGVSNSSYGSMTAGAVGALCIYDYYLGQSFRNDPSVGKGLEWLAANYDVKRNPRKKEFFYLYYLYALERAGILFGTEKIGSHEWYPDGAVHLLATQMPGGAWDSGDKNHKEIAVDTCFAILFLRRGTQPLKPVATQSAIGGKAAPGAPPGPAPPAGIGDASSRLAGAFSQFAPGWTLSGCGDKMGPGLRAEVRGRKDVFATYPPGKGGACTIHRVLQVPAGKKASLRLVVGHDPEGGWGLTVRAEGVPLLTKTVDKTAAPEGWFEATVDLSGLAGRSVQLEILHHPGTTPLSMAYWAEIVLAGAK